MLAALMLSACGHEHAANSDGRADDDGHAHAEPADAPGADDKDAAREDAGHGHGHGSGIKVTHFAAQTELFVEYPPLVSGQSAAFAAHLTWTGERFRAVDEGTLAVTLDPVTGGSGARVEAGISTTPGIFRPALTPGAAGRYRLRLALVAGNRGDVHDLGEVEVHPDPATADAALPAEAENEEGIPFTKEQQWKLDFAHAPAETRELRETVPASAVLRLVPSGEAFIVSPLDGVLDARETGFPQVGMTVSQGQVMLTLMPRLATGVDLATLEAEVERARIRHAHAAQTAARLARLANAEAIAPVRAIDAALEARLAASALTAAQRRLGTARGAGGGVPLRAPLAGTVVAVETSRGAAVREGQTLVHLANLERLWLQADVPEVELAQIVTPTGVSLGRDTAPGAQVFEVGRNARLIAFGGIVDAASRTVPLILEVDNPDGILRAGQRLDARVFTGRTRQGVAVPVSAVSEDNGQDVVFVMLDGEAFARRVVRTGLPDGEWIGIESGLAVGERVVTVGAYQVRLAATAPAEMGHGHAH
ncbi:MAG: efflux RND transporter periplasmic adaptor subunit [Gammaproteobacteria bacterium]